MLWSLIFKLSKSSVGRGTFAHPTFGGIRWDVGRKVFFHFTSYVLRPTSYTILSFLLLFFAYPPYDFWILAWGAFVPFLRALDGKRPGVAFGLGYLLGVLFFAGTLYWFIYVTKLGASLLVLYLASYFGLFGLGYSFFSRKKLTLQLFLIPSLWVALEFMRSHFLSGFGWASLGHSQIQNLVFIQMADLTGMYGVSFLIVLVNFVIKQLMIPAFKREGGFVLPEKRLVGGVGICFVILAVGYGLFRLSLRPSWPSVRVAVVQANIPQELKWERSSWPSIMEKYLALTKEVVLEKPELIIWPETAFPGFLWEDPVLFEELKQFVAHHGIPLLLGVVTQEEESYYNSALLISERGEVIQQYNKLHLVPFGEYIPWRQFFPFLSQIVPIADFSSGREYTLFPIPKKNNQARDKEPGEKKFFSVVICFEDTVARLVRGFARQGSSLLVNITNDAWFQDTKAPFMHLAASLLRSIEMRKSLIRAANTGVSCFIDPHGRILKCVHNEHNKKTYVAGYAIQEVPLNLEKTFYTKFGDIFTYLCFGCILGGIILEKQVRL